MAAAPEPWIPRFFVLDGGEPEDAAAFTGGRPGDYLIFSEEGGQRHLSWAWLNGSGGPRRFSVRVRQWSPGVDLDHPRELSPGEVEELLRSAPSGVDLPPFSLERFSPSAVGAIGYALGFSTANGTETIHMEHLLAGLGVKQEGALKRLAGERFDDLIATLEAKHEARLAQAERIHTDYVPRLSSHVLDAFLAAVRTAEETNKGYVQHHILLAGARTVEDCSAVTILEEFVEGGEDPVERAFDGVRFATHLSDRGSDVDRLKITPYVEALAALLINHDVAPPLSVGLFGDWGAGKSFFISKLKGAVDKFSRDARTDLDLPFCRGCAQIEFNAWQYADADLWSSLVTHILGELSVFLSGGKRDESEAARKKLVEGLSSVEDRKEQLKSELASAHRETAAAKNEAEKAARQRRRVEAGLVAAEKLGVVDTKQRDALGEVFDEADGEPFRATLRHVLRSPAAFAAVALAALAVGLGWFSAASEWIAAAPAALGIVLAGWKALRAYSAFREVSEGDGTASLTEADKKRIAELEADEQAKRAEWKLLQKEEQELEAKLAGVNPRAALLEVLGRRPAYERSLGLISQIHRDFSELGDLIERIRAESGKDSENAEQNKGPKIERIVLYIDDLDRCEPKRVVEVLQAVHLLLALDLFVVVVAVDPRWLRRALEVHYPELLLTKKNSRLAGEIATPRDYLEKIFQVPFVLPSLDAEKSSEFLQRLLEREGRSSATADPGLRRDASPTPTDATKGQTASQAASNARKSQAAPASGDISTAVSSGAAESDPAPEAPLSIEARRVELTEQEKSYLAQMGGFFSTPRAAKRFLNSYRLLRATVDVGDLESFVGNEQEPGPYRGAIMMTAVAVSFPCLLGVMRRSDGMSTIRSFIADFGDPDEGAPTPPRSDPAVRGNCAEDMEKLGKLLDAAGPAVASVPLAHCREWASGAERFTFQA